MSETSGYAEPVDTTGWKVCECCNQKIAPSPTRTFRVTHKLETPGLPTLFCLRVGDVVQEAEQRESRGVRAHGYVWDAKRNEWGYWRSWGPEGGATDGWQP